ncbi:uncharacterized protein PFL1_00523 [Pseudozyma flocculosa PF-1]|uniref:AB hydrolase-1 domain-containing protein n=1 Tax=Pseudozyma flocculosa TaxID=84751 RepID=A0A5C3EQR2_9BASI|nr:uncharacterized protein PFL1_00523 [Pseudozyma flocculosa PF-1]EPQ32327.1 hypothetical protein PFL1_00523 [Pseudozyma flocculosa PF-1]SPO34714.1 uncharacterized protein PSFLO_00185 [Pseudozyma flocculosa]
MAANFLARAHVVPLGIVAIYTGFLCAMFTPLIQKHFLFLHKIPFPLFADFDHPERYGLAPFKTRNFRLTTADNVSIGAWHILPEAFYQAQDTHDGPIADDLFDDALKQYPTIIYLHGNAANRAAPFRIRAYSSLSTRLAVNVIAIDYRGFGDSDGDPSERGVVLDARAAFDFVRTRSGHTDGSGIVVFGQSLGSGVAAAVTHELHEQGTPPQAVVLMAAYSSINAVISNFRIAGLLPVLAPLKLIPGAQHLVEKYQVTKFATDQRLPRLLLPLPDLQAAVSETASDEGPSKGVGSGDGSEGSTTSRKPHIVILHADDDAIIPVSHSRVLWDALVSSHTQHHGAPPAVRTRTIERFAEVHQFHLDPIPPSFSSSSSSNGDATGAKATYIRTLHGGHDHLTEGAVDQLGLAAGLLPRRA